MGVGTKLGKMMLLVEEYLSPLRLSLPLPPVSASAIFGAISAATWERLGRHERQLRPNNSIWCQELSALAWGDWKLYCIFDSPWWSAAVRPYTAVFLFWYTTHIFYIFPVPRCCESRLVFVLHFAVLFNFFALSVYKPEWCILPFITSSVTLLVDLSVWKLFFSRAFFSSFSYYSCILDFSSASFSFRLPLKIPASSFTLFVCCCFFFLSWNPVITTFIFRLSWFPLSPPFPSAFCPERSGVTGLRVAAVEVEARLA